MANKRKEGSHYKNTQRWRHKAKRWLIEYAGGKCQSCGYEKYYGNLTFHHLFDKIETISRMVIATMSWIKIMDEVNKCVLVCSNCHGEIHGLIRPCPEINMESRRANMINILARQPLLKKDIFHPCLVCQKLTNSRKYCSQKCHKINSLKIKWPENEELSKLVMNYPMTTLSKQFGVTDKAIKKHCIKFGIMTPDSKYWSKHPSSRRSSVQS